MLTEKIIEFGLKWPGLLGLKCTHITAYFHDKTKNLLRKFSIGLLFTAKILQGAMYLASPTLVK